jgi:glutathione S-transferase
MYCGLHVWMYVAWFDYDVHVYQGVNVLGFKQHWIGVGMAALDVALREPQTGKYCHGDQFTLADCCLVPHV